METFHCIGMDLPVIKRLADGVALCTHPNGPAICSANEIASLCSMTARAGRNDNELEYDDEFEPSMLDGDGIGREAIAEYVKLTWPLIRDKFFPNESWKTFFAKQT